MYILDHARLYHGASSRTVRCSAALLITGWIASLTTPVAHSLLVKATAASFLFLLLCARRRDVLSPPSNVRSRCWAVGLLLGICVFAHRASGSRDALSWLETLVPIAVHYISITAQQRATADGETRHGGRQLLLAATTSAAILPWPWASVNQVALGACYVMASSLALWLLEDILGSCPAHDSLSILDEKASRRLLSDDVEVVLRDVTWTTALVCIVGTWLFESTASVLSMPPMDLTLLIMSILSTATAIWFLLSLIHMAGAEHASLIPSVQVIFTRVSNMASTKNVCFGLVSVASTVSSSQSLFSDLGLSTSRASRIHTILLTAGSLFFVFLTIQAFLHKRQDALQNFAGAVNTTMLPTNEMWQPMHLADDSVHPIEYLTLNAQQQYDELLGRQSSSLKAVVSNYKDRYQLLPPPLFDKWYEFAKQRNVGMLDEFDTIHDSMLPFWALKPRILRARVTEALGFDGNGLIALIIRNGMVHRVEGGEVWQQESLKQLVQNFVHFLPDLDIAFNRHDEPRIIVPHDELSRMVLHAKQNVLPETLLQPNHRNEFSSTPDDMNNGHRIAEVLTSRFNNYAHQNTWIPSRLSCSPYSAARDFKNTDESTHIADNKTAYALGELGFTYNLTASTDVCSSPSFKSTHGFFDRPNVFNVAHELIPIFSESKVSSFQDILFPSMWHWNRQLPVERTDTMHKNGLHKDMYNSGDNKLSWEQKHNSLWWRGSTTGGYSKNGAWRHHHRQRLVKAVNALDRAQVMVPVQDESLAVGSQEQKPVSWAPILMDRKELGHLFNVSFSGVGQCSPADCHAQEEFFVISPHVNMSQTWSYRHLLDMDGNAFSARFYALLQSGGLVHKMQIFREWHDEWVKPWVHYVPLSLSGVEWAESMRFLSQEDSSKGTADVSDQISGGRIAKAIAKRGKAWVETGGGRREAMEVWMFRLLLEYARIVDDNRLEIAYDG